MSKQTTRVLVEGDEQLLDQLNLTNAKPLAVAIVDTSGNQTVPTGTSGSVGDGTATVTTAGTRVQLTAQACKRVIIQAHESNTGTLVVGGSTVVATLIGRRGVALFATQSEVFQINNMNLLYIDSTIDGDKINFFYEA